MNEIQNTPDIWNPEHGNHIFNVAKQFANSDLVPAHFKGKPENVFIALTVALDLGMQPFVVLQNLYVVHGTPGFSSKFLIALANRSGIFTGPLHLETIGEGDDMVVKCSAVTKESGQVCEMSASMAMAKAEGWTKNSKYKSMPEVMLGYRAASLFVRRYCPEVTLGGMQTVEEIQDIGPVADVSQPDYSTPAQDIAAAIANAPKDQVDLEPVETGPEGQQAELQQSEEPPPKKKTAKQLAEDLKAKKAAENGELNV